MKKMKSTKRALLTSALALLLCVSMLIGSTFAWFTDSVTSAGNTIQSGTLDVDLIDAQGKSLAGEVLEFVDQDDNDLWEPGCTYKLEEVYVANKGTLALKYEIAINGITGDAKLLEAIEWTVTVNGVETELADLKGDLAAGATSDAIVLTGHMKEEAGNEYQDLTVDGISIAVFATQLTSESDSFNNQYDKDAVYYDSLVTNANELYTAVAAASENSIIAIDGNIVLTKALSKSGLKTIKFVAMNENATIDQATYNMHFSGAKVTFEGLTLTHGEKAYGNGGQTSTAFAVWDAKEVNYIDCTFNRSVGTIHAALHNFIGCTFNGVENPDNTKSEYPLYICDGENYNVIDCVFNCTNRGAILFFNDGGSGVDTLNISNTSFLGDIIADKTAVEIHNNSNTQIYNVNIKDVVVGNGVINGLYRIKPANVGEVNVTVDGVINNATIISSADELVALGGTKINGNYLLTADIDMAGKAMKSMEVSSGAQVVFYGNGHSISNLNLTAANIHGMTGAGNEVAGLFDLTAPATTVSLTVNDLTVKNATVSCSGYAAAIVGYNSNSGSVITLNNVDVHGAKITAETVAALVGYSTGAVNLEGCDVSALDLTGEEGRPEKVGAYIGTANTSTCVVKATDCTNGTDYNDCGRTINGATYN